MNPNCFGHKHCHVNRKQAEGSQTLADEKWQQIALSCGEVGSGSAARYEAVSYFNNFNNKLKEKVNNM